MFSKTSRGREASCITEERQIYLPAPSRCKPTWSRRNRPIHPQNGSVLERRWWWKAQVCGPPQEACNATALAADIKTRPRRGREIVIDRVRPVINNPRRSFARIPLRCAISRMLDCSRIRHRRGTPDHLMSITSSSSSVTHSVVCVRHREGGREEREVHLITTKTENNFRAYHQRAICNDPKLISRFGRPGRGGRSSSSALRFILSRIVPFRQPHRLSTR